MNQNYEYCLNYNNDSFSKLKYGLNNKLNILKQLPKEYRFGNLRYIEHLKIDIENLIQKSIPNSFGIEVTLKLTAPLYSKDDDEFYIISNPMLKDKAFKVPMIRGSSIKGALLHNAIEILKEEVNIENLKSFFRIFGVGNDTFRAIFKKEGIDINQLQLFLAFEIGINPNESLKEAFERYKQSKAQKGRAIFYPIYFDKLSLEVINPHNRKTKAGTNPIYYEVVPKGCKSTLQIIYIPFDAILEDDKKIQKEAKKDLEFLTKCIEKLSQNGLGAKTKLGWGRFDILDEDKKVCLNSEFQIPEGWKKCQD
ncbi:hypothetical protein FE773_07130 [Caminibacter mediatlanticus TB-2]|uniref:CRISPR type III-associated protein domain-containing protein n=1 Tax=Caminibacter mediatlanticus TB-2 TaxID=391592 RepID=A0ABX5VAG1_9BACT|nr:RAMP superfamily CRISPR-associated protein [Caminibacter mediatlanticus]QCT94969.1 hypothetical protein FE773_07130 [Caminibacter mediatlanticus TB-2]